MSDACADAKWDCMIRNLLQSICAQTWLYGEACRRLPLYYILCCALPVMSDRGIASVQPNAIALMLAVQTRTGRRFKQRQRSRRTPLNTLDPLLATSST